MIEIALFSAFLFGHGNWECDTESIYTDGMKEVIHSHVIAQKNLKYDENIVIKYYKVGTEETKSQLKVKVHGYKKVNGRSFKAFPDKVKVTIDFDNLGIFTTKFIKDTETYYQEESSEIDVLTVTEKELVLKNASNNKAQCYPGSKNM